MAITATTSKVHWNYFLALERDLEIASRYVEFSDQNMGTYSIEFAHLLFAAASEVDVVAKLLCQRLNPVAPRGNIDHYKAVLSTHLPDLLAMQVLVPRYGLTLTPWQNWATGSNPNWWHSYNNVKHERDAYFNEATLKNSLNALAGLLIFVFYHYSQPGLQIGSGTVDNKETTLGLLPESSLMRLPEHFYYDELIF